MLGHRKTLAQIKEREKWPPSRHLKSIYYKAKSSLVLFFLNRNKITVSNGYFWKKEDERNLFTITTNKSRRETD